MPLTPSQSSASKLRNTHAIFIADNLSCFTISPPPYLKCSKYYSPGILGLLHIHLKHLVALRECVPHGAHFIKQFANMIGKLSRDVVAINIFLFKNRETDFQKVYQMQFQPYGSRLETELKLHQIEVLQIRDKGLLTAQDILQQNGRLDPAATEGN